MSHQSSVLKTAYKIKNTSKDHKFKTKIKHKKIKGIRQKTDPTGLESLLKKTCIHYKHYLVIIH